MEENNWLNNPELYGSGCILSASGIDFEPALFLENSIFDPKLIIFKGSMGFKTFEWVGEVRPRTKVMFEYRHLILKASKSEANAIQIKETMLFLKRYRNEILRLSKFSNVRDISLTRAIAKGDPREEASDEFVDLAFSCGVSILM